VRGLIVASSSTTSSFTADARAFVDRVQSRRVLIDGAMLAREIKHASEMVKRNVDVEVRESYGVKRLDEAFFKD
jgi:restriction system protein